MIEKIKNLSIKTKLIIILIQIIILSALIGIIFFNKQNTKTELTSATSKNLGI
ncbi:MAG: hypothetical protein IKL55_03645 [Clostridia bacterium]|nr:hypothetical protein [Clostridia bacterium]